MPVCHARNDGGGGASRLWRAAEADAGVADPGNSLTDRLTERHAAEDEERETDREREGQ